MIDHNEIYFSKSKDDILVVYNDKTVARLKFSIDVKGSFVVSTSEDKEVKFWNGYGKVVRSTDYPTTENLEIVLQLEGYNVYEQDGGIKWDAGKHHNLNEGGDLLAHNRDVFLEENGEYTCLPQTIEEVLEFLNKHVDKDGFLKEAL